jgi:hypothetical protein
MIRKSIQKLFLMRKKNSQTLFDADKMNREYHDYKDDESSEESDSSRVFRHTFIDKFEIFKHEAEVLANGNANFNDNWKDTVGREGLGISSAVIAGVIGVLGAVGVLSAAVSAGIAIPVAVVGILSAIAFYKYREHIKQERFERAAACMDREDMDAEIHVIARLLADLYALQLQSCTVRDAHVLADSCFKAISNEMLKNKSFSVDELLEISSLQGVLMRALSSVPKVKLDMNIVTDKKFNARGLISHSAYYCRETDEYYHTTHSKPSKYGVLLFDKKQDLEDYESILTSIMKDGEKWKFSKMRPHEVSALKRSSMFKAYKNDKLFEGKKAVKDVSDNERIKVT